MASKDKIIKLLLCVAVSIFIFRHSLVFSQTSVQRNDETGSYYLQLKTSEFQKAMLPREKFLLDIAKNTSEELKTRQLEGKNTSNISLNEIVSPQKRIMEDYLAELDNVTALLDEISDLERKARQKVNFQVLEALSQLRERVKGIINGSINAFNSDNTEEKAKNKTDSPNSTVQSESKSDKNLNVKGPSPADIFEEWKYNRILEFKMKLSRWKLLRTQLLNTADQTEYARMFRRAMRSAFEHYQAGDFLTARLEFEDILNTYNKIRILDDLYYFSGEAAYGRNFFDEAIGKYQSVVKLYPDSEYAPRALVKLIFIYSIYGDIEKINQYYQALVPKIPEMDRDLLSVVSYLAGYSYFKIGYYERVFSFLKNVPEKTTYYYPSLYLSATCYANIGKTDIAINILKRLIEEENKSRKDLVLEQIKNNALLKLGLIYYDLGNSELAVSYLNRVSRNYTHYDLTILGKAWSEYKAGKPGEALKDVEELLQNSMLSSYAYEAKVLAASVKDIMGFSEEAVKDLKEAYQIGTVADKVLKKEQKPAEEDRFLVEQSKRQTEQLAEISKIKAFLHGSLSWENKKTDNSNVENLIKKIEELDNLEKVARDRQDGKLLSEVRSLRSELIKSVQDQTERFAERDVTASSIVTRLGMNEYLRYTFQSILTEITREKKKALRDISKAKKLVQAAKENDNFSILIRTEIRKEELEDYYRHLNQYEVWLRENFPRESNIEIDKWASFSGYGISNINFMRIKEYDKRISDVARVIDTIDNIFNAKRKDLDNRIQGLLSDVEKIEEQMQIEALKRQKAQKDKFFKNEYFIKQKGESAAGELKEKPGTVTKEKK